jgi:hypothetical protein
MTEISKFLTDVCVTLIFSPHDDADSAKTYLALTQTALTNKPTKSSYDLALN